MHSFDLSQIVKELFPDGGSHTRGMIRSFQCDSRLVQEGDLFFALKGEKNDGHHYLGDVAQRRACAAVVAINSDRAAAHDLCLLPVPDVLKALHQLAAHVFKVRQPMAVGITGSVGKTTTKEFVATLLEGSFSVAKTPGSANSQVGLPLSILNELYAEKVFVMEMGMSLPGELTRLVKIAPPEIALITQIALAHSAFFQEGLESIAAAKAEILGESQTRSAVIHAQAMSFKALQTAGSCCKLTYGKQEDFPEADIVWLRKPSGIQIIEKSKEASPIFLPPFTADHLIDNLVGAMMVCRRMGLDWKILCQRVKFLKTASHRFEWMQKEGVDFLNDSYNANPASMKAALHFLQTHPRSGKLIAVLGSMRELGTFEAQAHREVGELAGEVADRLICIGKECSPLVEGFAVQNKPVDWLETLSEVRDCLFSLVQPGDVVLLKGSNSHQLWKILR